LNDNDITGAQQVLLKIVTGDGEGEIKMSELSKIKNKIQEAAGRDVNIIEGIGIDTDLGMSISVTVIATGFEQRKKPKNPTTISLNDNYLNSVESNAIVENVDLGIESQNVSNHIQQTLNLDDEINDEVNNIQSQEKQDKVEPIDKTEADSVSEKIIFNLNDVSDYNTQLDETAEEVIESIILEKEPEITGSKIELDLDNEIKEESTLNTFEGANLNTEGLKIESRERESRLRSISMQLRTPSGLTSLEDIPAYKRNNIDISETPHSSDSEVSSFTLTNDENNITELKQNNTFLHDNVD
jgi:cell division protein FtsZ